MRRGAAPDAPGVLAAAADLRRRTRPHNRGAVPRARLPGGGKMPDSLTVVDNRTGERYEFPIAYGTYPDYGAFIRGADLRRIKASPDDFGLLSYDPAFLNTASCESSIGFIDGDRGILRY